MNGNISYTVVDKSIRIDKIEQPQSVVVIPEKIEGYPVTELAPYILAGSKTEELWLPMQLRKIGAYGFYNCERLRRIHCSSRATDLGTGLFAGAGGVDFVDMTVFDGEKSCLKELLSELRHTLRVRFHLWAGKGGGGRGEDKSREDEHRKDNSEGDEGSIGEGNKDKRPEEARLIFPEYYEESVENTPARILYIETHGCGHRYRYCFTGTQFQYQKYDELFPHVKVQETEELVTELALGRLQYPLGLVEKYREMYQRYVAEHWQTAARLMIRADIRGGRQESNLEPGGIPWLVKDILKYGQNNHTEALAEGLQEMIRMAQESGDTEAVAWLMDYRRRQGSPGRRRFAL